MLKFALKNMAIKKVQLTLVALSIIISAGVAVLSYNTACQVNDGITGTAGYYSAIIGPAGSKTQLAMNTMYFSDEPLGTVPYSLLSELQQDMRVTQVIPFAMADSYNGYSIVGTGSAYLAQKAIASGRLFADDSLFEVVVGSTVARTCGLSPGDQIYTSHSAGVAHKTPFTVVGILEESHTVYDRTVFTQLRTIWEVHEEEEGEHADADDHDGSADDHGHDEMHGRVCAILVRTQNPAYAMTLVNDYDGRIYTEPGGGSCALQAIEPMATVRSILEETNNTKYLVFALCGIILLMNILIISIITLLNMYHSAKEISLMRLIGISMKKINRLYLIQNALIGLISTLLAFGISRLCLALISDYVATMGVVLNPAKIYPLELVILAGVFVISVLPTMICTNTMARKDSMG